MLPLLPPLNLSYFRQWGGGIMQWGEIREHPSPCKRLTRFLLPVPTRRSDSRGMLPPLCEEAHKERVSKNIVFVPKHWSSVHFSSSVRLCWFPKTFQYIFSGPVFQASLTSKKNSNLVLFLMEIMFLDLYYFRHWGLKEIKKENKYARTSRVVTTTYYLFTPGKKILNLVKVKGSLSSNGS